MGRTEQTETLVESLRRERIAAALFGEPAPTPTIGRFEILGTLGRGGMGEVLDARDPTLDRAVALKLLQRRADHQQPRLLREAQALARLSHPNVVQVYEVGLVDGRLFIAMERLRGQTLHAWQATPRPWTECLDAYLQAGAGLAAAHAEGLIHRDFKPTNCMIDEHGRVRVLDFGLARATSESETEAEVDALEHSSADTSIRSRDSDGAAVTQPSLLAELLTRSGALLGTVAYMAPEQLLGVGVDARSDQFGFCVALFEALHGHRPFAGRTGAELLLAVQRGAIEPGSAREGLPAVPRALDRVVRRGLALDGAARWPNMAALLESLAGVRDRRRRRAWASGVGLLVATGIIAAIALPRARTAQPCEGLRELEAPAWTAEQRGAVEQGLLEHGPRGAEVWPVVARALDRYANDWSLARAEACEATHVHHSVGPHTLELRLACLDRRMQRMHALVEQLSILDRRGLASAVEAAHSLPALDPCSDADALLRSEIATPIDERARQLRVERLVDEGWAMQRAGRALDGAARADAAIEQVAALDEDRSIVAEARLLRGSLHFDARRSELARADLQAAFRSAERSNHRALAREILTQLVHLEVWAHRPSAAQAWLIMAEALGPSGSELANISEQAELAAAAGLVRLEQGDHVGAIEQLELAVARRREQADELALATALRLLGEARSRANDPAGARTAYLESLTLARANAALAMIAQTLHDLGVLERDLGEPAKARAAFEEALALQIEVFGDRAPVSIHTRIGLADVALAQDDLAEAVRQAEAAQVIAKTDPALEPEDRGLLGMLLASLHRELDQPATALDDYTWAREAFEAMPEIDHGAVAMADSGAADCLVALGQLEQARPHYERALERLARHVEPSHRRWLYPQLGLGRLLLAQGQLQAARPLLERALTLTGPGDEELAASIREDILRIP